MRKLLLIVVLLALTAGMTIPAFAQTERPSIPELLTDDADGRFTTLLAAVEAAGLVETLSGEGPFTVFAPTNDAFAASLEALGLTAEEVLADTDLLTSILTYHVVPGRYFFRDLTSGPLLTTVQGEDAQLDLTDGAFTIAGVNISDVDNLASNGIVHVIDGVLLPPSIVEMMAAAPEPTVEPTAEPTAEPTRVVAEAPARPSIAEVLTNDADGRFTTLLAAVEAAGLTETLSGEGTFTVLAPTNDAFTAALEFLGLSVEDVLANPDTLTQVLTYHVLPEIYFSRNLFGGAVVETVNGASVSFGEARGGGLAVNGTRISDVDNVAGNGVIQVLDGVLIPPGVFDAARVRIAHFAPDAPAVAVRVNGVVADALNGLAYSSVTPFIEIAPSPNTIVEVLVGDRVVIGPAAFSFAPGSYTTVAAIGSVANSTLTAALIAEDYSPINTGSARITVFHAINDQPAVNILVDGALLVGELGYPGSLGDNDGVFIADVAAGTYDLSVNSGGSPFLTAPDTEIVAGTNYLVVALGTSVNPILRVYAVDTFAVAP